MSNFSKNQLLQRFQDIVLCSLNVICDSFFHQIYLKICLFILTVFFKHLNVHNFRNVLARCSDLGK